MEFHSKFIDKIGRVTSENTRKWNLTTTPSFSRLAERLNLINITIRYLLGQTNSLATYKLALPDSHHSVDHVLTTVNLCSPTAVSVALYHVSITVTGR